MKKKFALVLAIVMMVLTLGACGTDPKTVNYNGYTYDQLKQITIDSVEIVEYISENLGDTELSNKELEVISENTGFSVAQLEASPRWYEVSTEFGNLTGVDESSFHVSKSGETLTTNIVLFFEKKNVDFQLVYKYHSMELTGVTIEPVYSLGEKMEKAGLNTLISMSIVFVVLILISLIIYCFNIFPYLEKKRKEKKADKTDSEKDQVVTQIEQREQQTDDAELIAVIAAAIAASEGTSTGDFVVRSINRR